MRCTVQRCRNGLWRSFGSRRPMRVVAAGLLVSAALGCSRVEASRPSVEVEMRNVDLHMTGDVTLHVRHLRGRFVPTGSSRAPHLDDTSSYHVVVQTGQVAMDLASLNAVITRTLGDGRSNVRKLRVDVDKDGTLRQQGKIDKAIDLPFSAKSDLDVTADGRLRIHTRSMRGFGMPMTPLLKLFRIELDDLLRVEPGNGVTVSGNDILLDPSQKISPAAEALLFMASRAELVPQQIDPALARGVVVLMDRFFLSTYAYQIYGRGLPEPEIRSANALAVGGLVPDLTIVLEISATEGMHRASVRGAPDRMEQSGKDFHDRVERAFSLFAGGDWQVTHKECGPIAAVDGRGSPGEVHARVVDALARNLPEKFSMLSDSKAN